MGEGTKAKREEPPTEDRVTIFRIAKAVPPSPPDSPVANSGDVYFTCAEACWIWTFVNQTLANAFGGEDDHHLSCHPGENGPFIPVVADETITIVPAAVNSNPPPFPIEESITVDDTITVKEGGRVEEIVSVEETITFQDVATVKGTIKVGSGG
ncbi:MAG: hypothetical protein WCD49_04550 [Candidatus Acidiferrales bacterium]